MGDYAERVNGMPTYVASRTLAGPLTWTATLIEGEVVQSVAGLKETHPGNLIVSGCGELAHALSIRSHLAALPARRGLSETNHGKHHSSAGIGRALGGAAMDTSAYLNTVVEQTNTFADWVQGRDASTPVPTTPKWTLADLVNHVGGTQREMAMLVSERMAEPSRAFASYVPGPTDSAQWRAWLTDGAAKAKQAFESVTDDTPVWDPFGGAAGVRYWSRRLFGEACVHRADAAAALGERYELAPELAVEAIDDWLYNITSRVYWEFRPDFADAMRGGGQTLHFHATDAPGEWLVRREPDMVVLERTHIKTDVAVRGPATDLLLVISRRRPLDAAPTLEVHGDRALLDHWIQHMDWVTDG